MLSCSVGFLVPRLSDHCPDLLKSTDFKVSGSPLRFLFYFKDYMLPQTETLIQIGLIFHMFITTRQKHSHYGGRDDSANQLEDKVKKSHWKT